MTIFSNYAKAEDQRKVLQATVQVFALFSQLQANDTSRQRPWISPIERDYGEQGDVPHYSSALSSTSPENNLQKRNETPNEVQAHHKGLPNDGISYEISCSDEEITTTFITDITIVKP
jgi:hypothetical protein